MKCFKQTNCFTVLQLYIDVVGNVSDAAESFRAFESFLHAIVKLTRKKKKTIYRYVVYLSARKYPCSNLSALAIKETKEMRNVTGGSSSFSFR